MQIVMQLMMPLLLMMLLDANGQGQHGHSYQLAKLMVAVAVLEPLMRTAAYLQVFPTGHVGAV